MIAFVGVVLIGLYFSSRKGVLKITSAGDAITVNPKESVGRSSLSSLKRLSRQKLICTVNYTKLSKDPVC